MDGMNLLIIVILGYLFWKIFRSKSQSESKEGRSHLSETQLAWRRSREEGILKKLQEEQGKVQHHHRDMKLYIKQNMRKFNVWEWLSWKVDLRFLSVYLSYIGGITFAFIVAPLLFSVPILWLSVLLWMVIVDVWAYQKYRLMEVTVWNPEWHRKFRQE